MSKKYKPKRKSFFTTLGNTLAETLFGDYFANIRSTMRNSGSVSTPVTQDNTGNVTVDFALVRQLYRNTNNKYALSAQLVKPVIDSNVNFIGIPTIRATNKKTLAIIDSFKKDIPYFTTHRLAEREGVAYIWPQINKDGTVRFEAIPPENVKTIVIDPKTKEVIGYVIIDSFSYKDFSNTEHIVTIEITIDAQKVTKKYVGDMELNGKTVEVKNIFGFIPLIVFLNDNEPWELSGHSEIENIEPQLKLYNDMTVEAARSQKRDGHPKMKIKTQKPDEWVDNNFGAGTFELMRQGKAKLRLDENEIFICQTSKIEGEEGEDVAFIESNRVTGEYSMLSEKSFTNIVEGAQTPEIIFGANMGTSLASVREQRPAYIKKIQRKQAQYEDAWRKLIIMTLRMVGITNFEEIDENFYFTWPIPDFSSEKEKAETVNVLTNALIKAKEAHLIGDKEIHETMKNLDNVKIEQDYKKHAKDVEDTAKLMTERTKDAEAAKSNEMNQRVADGTFDDTAMHDTEGLDNGEE